MKTTNKITIQYDFPTIQAPQCGQSRRTNISQPMQIINGKKQEILYSRKTNRRQQNIENTEAVIGIENTKAVAQKYQQLTGKSKIGTDNITRNNLTAV